MIFITGASSGIGEACARAFAAEKKPLLLVARRREKLQSLAKSLQSEHGITVHTLALDVSNRKAVEAFEKEQAKLLSQVTVLVNNAGLARGLDPIQDVKPEDWDEMIDTNIKGLLSTTKLVLPYFTQKKAGHIINLGSVAGHWVYPKGNVYCATKFAVHALTEGMRMDLHGLGIRVTEISPGLVETGFSEVRFGGDEKRAKAVYAGVDSLTPADVAEAVVWCASRPGRVNIQEIVLYPTDQAAPTMVNRKG